MTKELVKWYADLLYPDNQRMNDYIVKSVNEVIRTKDGYLLSFDKPTIKKNFCFGAGCNGLSTSEDWDIAHANAENARTNVDYFLSENLEDINKQIEELENAEKIYLITCMRSEKLSMIRRAVTDEYVRYWHNRYNDNLQEVEATKEDVELIINTLKSEKEKFEKRLNSYLKRYGLSKIHSWTYLVD